MSGRATLIGGAIEAIVMWSRVMDSHRMIPFGELNLSRAQLEVLFHIAHSPSPATPGAIAARLGVTAGAVTQLVAGLSDLGLVRQDRDTVDGRRRLLVLEPTAQQQVAGFEQAIINELSPRFDGLSDAELATLTGLLARTTSEATR
ncbi:MULTISPECIES: MarR family winged helix-turn-helix transcriptional regulator [Tessaracoccus]|uniref:MarR family winged helix-turn-helix transcriptional regulator n=1 Tax=Tessaracoccus TaxID=72763 RepID=UPI00099C740E|nr:MULTISPECIES: MarR family transcriptional regulator [Tessaracoccus]AQX14965.1 hypothetical protein BKM78_02740 [Tessaracoccus sp. T2.5-30]VEP39133.1 hypothetical protein TLA_TLA_00557 [Tessaracoccus lapidicaptus]